MNWKLKSKNNYIVNNELNESYNLHDVKDCLRLINKLNEYIIMESDLQDRLDSLLWENDNLKSENRHLRRYVREHYIKINNI